MAIRDRVQTLADELGVVDVYNVHRGGVAASPSPPSAYDVKIVTSSSVAKVIRALANQLLAEGWDDHQLLALQTAGILIQIPTGRTYLADWPVPANKVTRVDFDAPLFSVSLTNDGPQSIHYVVPHGVTGQFGILNINEVVTLDYGVPVISNLDLIAPPAGNGMVRIVGLY